MRRIVLNTSIVTDNPTGVGVYTLSLLKELKKYRLNFFEISINKNLGKLTALYRLFWNIFILPFLINKNDLVFSFSTHGSPFIKNQIVTVHDLISLNFPKQHRIQYYYFKYYVPILLRSCLKVVAISEFTKSEIVNYYGLAPEKIVVIHNGANFIGDNLPNNLNESVKHVVGEEPYFLCVGASYSHKNITRLIDAVHKANLPCKFVIIGNNNNYFNNLKVRAKDLGLSNIIFMNYVSTYLLSQLYHDALCNLYISLYEGFGFPPLEAANFNTISLVSRISPLTEIYKDSVIYVDPENTHDIACRIKEIYRNSKDYGYIKSKFPALISLYSWENTAKDTHDLLCDNK